MAEGSQVRRHILDFNMPTIKSRVAAMKPQDVLLLIDLGDAQGGAIHQAINMHNGMLEAEARADTNDRIARVGPGMMCTCWMIAEAPLARGILALTSGSPDAFDLARDRLGRDQRMVVVVAAAGNSYASVSVTPE